MRKKQNILGKKSGRLTITSYSHYEKRHHFWKYLCDCGKIGLITVSHFNLKRFKSCGCYRKESARYARTFIIHKRLPEGEPSFNWLYLDYQNGAKNRGYQFDIKKEDFRKIVISNCYYCNSIPKSIAKLSKYKIGFIYNGIDRMDSTKGYIKGNIVTCCKICNYAKRSMTIKEFINWIENVYNHTRTIPLETIK